MKKPTLNQLFHKPVTRNIDGVIKADDNRHLVTEVEEFVPTREIRKGLEEITERYLEEPTANGVWISGFFGSGKSHLLKMVALLLDDQPLPNGQHPAELLLPKIDDEILKGNLERAARIPSKSLLFNIDQKADHIGGDKKSQILAVFMKVFNEMRGFHAAQGHIAEFEYSLHKRGKWDDFLSFWQAETGSSWEDARIDIEFLDNETFARVYAKFSDTSEEEALRLFDRLRERYKVSIESFAEQVRAYIDEQGPDFRLNFFVDEIGQFVGQDRSLMLNLQTVAESLATVCNGRAWIFVTSQGDLKAVLGDMKQESSSDFTRIQGRFKTRINLTSADVREVIQKRLLAKTENEPEQLQDLYHKERENFATLYRFQDESLEFKIWMDCEQFCHFYPFPMYQFDLFQRCIEQLSAHNAFTGRHTSVGERSMLEVFQNVAKNVCHKNVGYLVPFDELFDGISSTLRGDMQTPILQAENQLDRYPYAQRILRALFLLKWVKGFKATSRNINLLLLDEPGADIAEHQKKVEEALHVLHANSYLQKNGEVYEFLTNIEKDIEDEIKNTEVDDSEVAKLLEKIVFEDVLRTPKLRYEANGQDYSFARKIDGQLVSREAEIGVNLITSEHPNYSSRTILAAQNTGLPELMFVLPESETFVDEARIYLKTVKYIQQQDSTHGDEARRSILTNWGQLNGKRRTRLTELCSELLRYSPVYLNGSELKGGSYADARTRLQRFSQDLIDFAYPSLARLRGTYTEEHLRKTLLDPDDLLTSGQTPLSEAEVEVETYVLRNQESGDRSTVEEILRSFGKRPYGWPQMATLVQIARLYRMSKLELRNPQLMSPHEVYDHFCNSRKFGSVRARLQAKIPPQSIAALKRFHQDFFHQPNGGQDARGVGEETQQALQRDIRTLQTLLTQRDRFPFVEQLAPVLPKLESLTQKDYTYLLTDLNRFKDELLDLREAVIDPIQGFLNGPQKAGYEEVIRFLREEQASFSAIPEAELQPLLDLQAAPHPYRGNVLAQAMQARDRLKVKIEALTHTAREEVLREIDRQLVTLREQSAFQQLPPEKQQAVLQPAEAARQFIQNARVASVVRDRLSQFRERDIPAILQGIANAVPSGNGKKTATYIPLSAIKIHPPKPVIETHEDLEAWLNTLRSIVQKELDEGNRITI